MTSVVSAAIISSWRTVFDEVLVEFGGWPSLGGPQATSHVRIERLYGIMVAKFRADSLFKATVQPDDKNSEKHVLLVGSTRKMHIREIDNCQK